MDNRIQRLEDKIDKICEELSAIKVILAAQHETLQEHHRRSLSNEQSLEILKEDRIKNLTRDRIIVGILTLLASSEFLMNLIARLLK